MAKKDEAAPALAEKVVQSKYEPETQYRLTLNRAVWQGEALLRPQDDVVVKGKVIAGLGDAVDKAEPI